MNMEEYDLGYGRGFDNGYDNGYVTGYKKALEEINKPMLVIQKNWTNSECPRCHEMYYDYEECDDGYINRAESLERCP